MNESSRSLLSGISVSQLQTSPPTNKNQKETVPEWNNSKNTAKSMSEKLRYLKSKINAAEATAQSVMGSTLTNSVVESDDSSTLASNFTRENTNSIFRVDNQQTQHQPN